jgi:FecR protein
MSRRKDFARLGFAAFLLAALSTLTLASSHVRIVRLSSVEGPVQIDRVAGGGLERAILNTPIVEGTRLVTGNDGLAEVEFENESAVRLTGDSEVKFTQLLMSDTGAKINQFEVTKGLVYLDTASKGDDIYRVKAGNATLLVHRDTLMRLSAGDDKLQVAVLRGDVQLENQAQPVSIHKKQTLTIDSTKPEQYAVVNSADPVRFDNWNKEREDYTKTYASSGDAGPSRAYGMQDLNYYGNFFYANGYGYAWQPFGFAGSMASWDPYSNGAWSFYPGLGYSFASAYPWGWLPFHYGSWAYLNGAGWAWLPGGGYTGQWYANSFQSVPRITKAPEHWTAATPPAIAAGTVAPRTVVVGSTSTALTVPGGRIPPDFASVVPGRTAVTAGNRGFVRPESNVNGTHAALANASSVHQGHVFAPRPVAASYLDGQLPGGTNSGIRGGGIAAAGPSGALTSSPAHSAGTAAHK